MNIANIVPHPNKITPRRTVQKDVVISNTSMANIITTMLIDVSETYLLVPRYLPKPYSIAKDITTPTIINELNARAIQQITAIKTNMLRASA